jgi:hypothetical protein
MTTTSTKHQHQHQSWQRVTTSPLYHYHYLNTRQTTRTITQPQLRQWLAKPTPANPPPPLVVDYHTTQRWRMWQGLRMVWGLRWAKRGQLGLETHLEPPGTSFLKFKFKLLHLYLFFATSGLHLTTKTNGNQDVSRASDIATSHHATTRQRKASAGARDVSGLRAIYFFFLGKFFFHI